MPIMPEDKDNSVFDILDWLSSVFGFQRGNVANQREHLILLLANIDVRNKHNESYVQLDGATVQQLMDKFFKNYRSWCDYLHCKSHIRIPRGYDIPRGYVKLRIFDLCPSAFVIFSTIWQTRFMRFYLAMAIVSLEAHIKQHHMVKSHFWDVITPIYEVMRKGKASHSSWRNYDDLNEYFWSKKCFKLGWPMDRKADFFVNSVDKQPSNVGQNQRTTGKRNPKTNFVEARTFCHLYGSFDRLWIFYILAFQALLIVAWSGSLSNLFNRDVSKNVLSIFITSAFLNFLQGNCCILSPKLYVGRGMHEGMFALLKYTLLWIMLLISKLAFSYYVELYSPAYAIKGRTC
ncbi:putative callose synthase 6 [Camellia lanceoleosa]|uniref:Callose synthase 6 n=1 Tax=Camellia lanceoleosa TaxID=1840588 RepID=A0ACC0H5L7_9ERIC|nr:putative callose synthase 6 [Camellia lanceoleosa]